MARYCEAAAAIAERVRASVTAQVAPPAMPPGSVTVSLGVAEMTARDFAAHVAHVLDTPVRYAGEKAVTTVAVCGGSGGSFIGGCVGQADAYVTGEVKHHEWLAYDGAINVIDAGHYATEVPVVDTLAGWLSEAYPDLAVTVYRDGDPYSVVK